MKPQSHPVTGEFGFGGYRRRDGRVGTRNHVLVLPSTAIVNRVVEIVQGLRPAAVCVSHHGGSPDGDVELMVGTLARFATSPNVCSTILVGIGDGDDNLDELQQNVDQLGGRVHRVAMLDEGGFAATVGRVVAIVDQELAQAGRVEREWCAISDLVLGTECGGSDAYSGLTANPAVGVCSDEIVESGGTAILAELTELIGTENILAGRASSPELGERIVKAIDAWRRFALEFGEDLTGENISPGNMRGGLTTIEEKSLGCVPKGGTSEIVDLVGFGERSEERGLVLMDTDGDDIGELVALTAGGANVIIFTTGRGTPAASPIVPTIKVSSNSQTGRRLASLIDLDAGPILSGDQSIKEIGRSLFEIVLSVADGELTNAEKRNQRDFALPPTAASA